MIDQVLAFKGIRRGFSCSETEILYWNREEAGRTEPTARELADWIAEWDAAAKPRPKRLRLPTWLLKRRMKAEGLLSTYVGLAQDNTTTVKDPDGGVTSTYAEIATHIDTLPTIDTTDSFIPVLQTVIGATDEQMKRLFA